MEQALCSILCGEDIWQFDEGTHIQFNSDGSGDLWCRVNLNYWIIAELQWTSLGIASAPPPQRAGSSQSTAQSTGQSRTPIVNYSNSQHLGLLTLSITLSTRLPYANVNANASSGFAGINERSLTGNAFRPKTFTVRIERGSFKEPGCAASDEVRTRFALRLLFDPSPYPPLCEWRDQGDGVTGNAFWDRREFVARRLPDVTALWQCSIQ